MFGWGTYLTISSCACRLLKIREEADPFSMDLGTLEKGHIVKVLEVRGWALVNLFGVLVDLARDLRVIAFVYTTRIKRDRFACPVVMT